MPIQTAFSKYIHMFLHFIFTQTTWIKDFEESVLPEHTVRFNGF